MIQVNRQVSLDEFKAVVEASGCLQREKDKEIYLQMLSIIEKADVQEDLILHLLKEIKQKDLSEKLAIACLDYSEGKGKEELIHSLYEKLSVSKQENPDDFEFVTDDLNELYNHTIGKPGLRWRLKSLNRCLGSLRKGDFGFIFARPETGKTTFLASEVSNFSTQTEQPILWINNEEQGSKVKTRVYQAVFGLPLSELTKDRNKYNELYTQITGNRIKLIDEASISRKKIEKICEKLQPGLVIIDQIDKIKGFDGERDDIKLGAIYQWGRELAKKYCPIIAVCQADGTAEGVKWLNMGHVTGAKTSKQAEADFIIGIGKTNEQGYEKSRYINISKNKLQGDEDSDPASRHGFFECIIEADVARYRDIGDKID